MINDDDVKLIIAKEEYLKGKKQLQSLEKKNQPNFKNWLLVASILLVITISGFWFSNIESTPKELYAEYFEPYSNVVTPVSRNDDTLSILERAFIYYENKDFESAILGFEKVLKTTNGERKMSIELYKAVSSISLNKSSDAIAILINYNKANTKFKDKYLWYLSLSYLQKEDVENAKKTLKILAKEKYNFKQKETLLLLESLE